jgi:hypothetical protein
MDKSYSVKSNIDLFKRWNNLQFGVKVLKEIIQNDTNLTSENIITFKKNSSKQIDDFKQLVTETIQYILKEENK